MHFLHITIWLKWKGKNLQATPLQQPCASLSCNKAEAYFHQFSLHKVFKMFQFVSNYISMPFSTAVSSSTPLSQCHTLKTLTPQQQRLGFNPFSGTPTFGHLPCQIILTVSTSPQAAVSEVSGIEWTWHPWKRIEGKYAQGHCHAKLTEAGCVKRGNFDPRQIAMTTLLHFLDNSYSSRCITKTTGQNVCTILAARCNCPSA